MSESPLLWITRVAVDRKGQLLLLCEYNQKVSTSDGSRSLSQLAQAPSRMSSTIRSQYAALDQSAALLFDLARGRAAVYQHAKLQIDRKRIAG